MQQGIRTLKLWTYFVKWLIIVFILSFLMLNLVTTTSDPKNTCMNCPDVILRCIKSHLCHVVSLRTCNVFYVRFYHCTACAVYLHCVHVRLLRVTLNINHSFNQKCNAAMIVLCPCQVWWSWVHAPLRTICQTCPSPQIARRKCAKSSITQGWIIRFRSNFVN